MFIVRQSQHINEDLRRNWSSFNYGLEGIEATKEEMEAKKQAAIDNGKPLYISGIELWEDDILNADIRELYAGYWVLVDTRGGYGLCCNILNAESLEEAITEVTGDGFEIELGEETRVDCSDAELVWSNGEIHILEV